MKFDFTKYVEEKKSQNLSSARSAAKYAYSADKKMLNGLSTLVPVRMAAEAYLRTYKDVFRGELLGEAVRVGKGQFNRLFSIVSDCAASLSIPIPEVFVVQHPVINAYTYGTNDDSFIVVHSATVDHMEDAELKFIIGHECGHIHCEHVTYYSVASDIAKIGSTLIGGLIAPAKLALDAWSRRSEVSSDRAGLICCKDPVVAKKALIKVALGSKKLYDEIDIPQYLSQMERLSGTIGRYSELFASHPYLPKRVKAIELFEKSALYYECTDLAFEGDRKTLLSANDLDEKVSEIITVAGGV